MSAARKRARDMLARTGARARVALQRYFNPLQGGIVRRMFWYLTAIIALTVGLSLVAWAVAPTQWQLLATLFWIRCGFGLLSAPFVVFKIPIVSTLLVPARKTSYDQLGHTVVYRPVVRHAAPGAAPSPVHETRDAKAAGASASAAAAVVAAAAPVTPPRGARVHSSVEPRARGVGPRRRRRRASVTGTSSTRGQPAPAGVGAAQPS